jgi:tellurite resistance protein
MVGKMDLTSVLEELTRAMQQCQQLYLSCVPPSEDLPETVSPHLAQNLDRLHRGLLAKTYATIAEADGRWTHEELRCAAALMQHLGVSFAHDALEPTARKLVRQARSLDWQQLFQPFHEIPELSFRAAELQAVIARVANLIAKADGFVAPKETKALQEIQESFQVGRRRAAAAAPPPLVTESTKAPEAVQAVWESAQQQRRSEPPKVDRAQLREQSLQRLEKLVGMGQVKHEICELADCVQFQSQRRRAKLPSEMPDLQFVFVGPSGTGKTLVARILSELLFASGGLRYGQLIEVNGFDLVSCEPREASKKMKAILTQAMGGTLVIEDAGALLLADNPSAVKALSVLRKNLAAHAGRVAVVLASVRADRLLPLLDQHSDLPRLFHRQWHFADYSTSELGRIFQFCCDRSQYRVTRLAQIKVLLGFHWCLRQDRKRFDNGHGAQRVYERAVRRLARRIAGISPLTKELLTTFHDSDITIEGVPAEALANLDDPQRVFAVTCPGCASVHLVGKDLLGIRVECKSCHHRFVSAWGEPVD